MYISSEKEKQILKFSSNLSFYFICLGIIGFVILLSPFIFEMGQTQNYGIVGDTIGGILNPLVAIGAGFLTFMAFLIQYEANKQVQNQFKIQQLESQFYEMLRLHKENVTEMVIEGYTHNKSFANEMGIPHDKKDKDLRGRKIFVSMNNELKSCYEIITNHLGERGVKIDKEVNLKYSYFILFLGLNEFERNNLRFSSEDKISLTTLKELCLELKTAQKNHDLFGVKTHKSIELFYNYKPYTGHQSRLAHYYRHLFQTVKFIVKNEVISYENKRNYLRILRAQLSNHEQVLLFYNWYCDFGTAWEEKNIKNRELKKGNYFFTDYRMIHNFSPSLLIKDFNIKTIFKDEYRTFKYEKDRKEDDNLFELINIPNLSNKT